MPEENAGTPAGVNADVTPTGGQPGNATPETKAEKANTEATDQTVPEAKISMTQTELDDLVKSRLARDRKDQAKKAEMNDLQRAQAERDDALKLVAESNTRDAFIAASGIEYAKATKLFRLVKDDIELDDSGKPTNLKTVVAGLKTDFPEFFAAKKAAPGGGDGGAGTGGGSGGMSSMDAAIRRAAGRKVG